MKPELDRFENPDHVPDMEGQFILFQVDQNRVCEVWTDQFGRFDVCWQSEYGSIVLGTGFDMLPVARKGALADSVS